MMNRHVTVNVRNLNQWVEAIHEMQRHSDIISKNGRFCSYGSPWIYRGQAKAGWNLSSSFERAVGRERWCGEDSDSLKEVESRSLAAFKTRAKNMGLGEQIDDVDYMAQMQHYGCPTRFVDFSEIPFVALYHAVYDEKEKGSLAVYAIVRDNILGVEFWQDPYQDAPEKISDHSEDLDYDLANAREIANWLINPKNPEPKNNPGARVFCIYPTFSNRRLEAQSGLFLMQRELGSSFEDDLKSVLECQRDERCSISIFKKKLSQESYYQTLKMVKFVFPKGLREEAKVLLRTAGITHKTIYPDFEGLAKYIKEICFVADGDSRFVVAEPKLRPKINLPMYLPVLKDEQEKRSI